MTDRGDGTDRRRSVPARPRSSGPDESHEPRADPDTPAPAPGAALPTADDRAQTVQDFAIGASVFLLTIAFVFAFIPTLFTPFESNVAPGLDSQADRVSDAIVAEGSIQNKPNWMTDDTAQEAIIPNENGGDAGEAEDLQIKYGLPSTSQINVTVTPMSPDEDDNIVQDSTLTGALGLSDDKWAAGDTYRGRPAATVSRIIVIEDVEECDPTEDADIAEPGIQGKACRLTIRIW